MGDIQETIRFVGTLLGPFFVWFSGKFLYNKWEKRKLEASAVADEVIAKQKEAELITMYEDIARRAAEDSINKSDRWAKLEIVFSEKIQTLEKKVVEQDATISLMRTQILILESEKNTLTCENVNLKQRVAFLESEMNTRNGNL